MWSWASELFGLIKPISISSADSFKPLPITGSKTYQNINKQKSLQQSPDSITMTTLSNLDISLSLSLKIRNQDDLTPRKLRTEASSQRPRSFATSDSKWDSSRTTIGSSALPSFTTTGRFSSTATSLAAAARVRRPPFMVSYERENKKVLERDWKIERDSVGGVVCECV